MKRAIAYTRDITFAQSGEMIPRGTQTDLLKRFAAEKAMEIVAWFEDERCEENLLNRPGIQALLAYGGRFDVVICERVWALSRSMTVLEPFLKELDRRGVGLETAESMWDCVSQQCRRWSKSLPVLPQVVRPEEAEGPGRYHVARPVRLNFVHLVHHARPSHRDRDGFMLAPGG
jgi:hypothetical protein